MKGQKDSSLNQKALISYITNNRSNLDIEEIGKILEYPNVNLDAKNSKGKTSLHLLADGNAAFKYSQLLISRGANFTIRNSDNETPLDAIIAQDYKGPLLFLFILAYHNNSEIYLPENLSDNQEIQPIANLFHFEFPENSKCGTIFNKLKDNYFNFGILEKDEIGFLDEMKKLNAEHNNYKGSSDSDNSDSEPETNPIETFDSLDLGENLKMIEVFREFLRGFASQIHNNNIECQKSSSSKMDNKGAEDVTPRTITTEADAAPLQENQLIRE